MNLKNVLKQLAVLCISYMLFSLTVLLMAVICFTATFYVVENYFKQYESQFCIGTIIVWALISLCLFTYLEAANHKLIKKYPLD